jgi:drug/metabolite transporter (DMT)-like permease
MAKFAINQRASVGLLVLATVIWGSTFPILKVCVGSMSPQAIVIYRFGLASLVLLPFLFKARKAQWIQGVMLGAVFFVGFATQAVGLQSASASRAGFITGTSVVMVPLIEILLRKNRPGWMPGFAAVIACIGVALLCGDGGGLTAGDPWLGACAVAFAFYIIGVARWTGNHPVMAFTAVQVITVAMLGIIWQLLDPGSTGLLRSGDSVAIGGVIYLAVFGTVAATALQLIGQRQISSTVAAIVFSAEPLFGVLFSMAFLNESLGLRGAFGGVLIIGAIFVAQIRPSQPHIPTSTAG